MKLIFKIMLISLTPIEVSCDDSTNQIIEEETFVQSVQLPDTVNLGESFEIELEVVYKSSCWVYSRLEKEIDGKTTSFKVFISNSSSYDTEVACMTAIFSGTIKEQISLNSLGANDLVFIGNDLGFNDGTLLKKVFVTN